MIYINTYPCYTLRQYLPQPKRFVQRRKKCRKTLLHHLVLAWNLIFNKCARIVGNLKNLLHSKTFIANHRKSPKDFTRQRKLPFHLLVSILINFVKGSLQDELDQFFKALNRTDVAKRVVSKTALGKARLKLKFDAFIELNRHLIGLSETTFKLQSWLGFRLIGVDGTTLQLPKFKDIVAHFGSWGVKRGAPCPMARVSQMFDCLNKISIIAVIDPKHVDEREQAAKLFLDLMPNDLVLLDRGYPAFWLFKVLVDLKAEFCARMPATFNEVRRFKNSGKNQKIIQLKPSSTSSAQCRKMGLDLAPIKLRLIRVELSSGQVEVLATTLLDRDRYRHEVFKELYHHRWPVETDYNYLKNWIEVENFTGQSVESVYQDFHARIFAKNLTAVLSLPAREALKLVGKKSKYEHQINFVQALSKSKHVLPLLFQRSKEMITGLISDLLEIILITTEPIRPGRKYPRNHKTMKRKFYSNYKRMA